MATIDRAGIDPNHHKGLIASDEITGEPFAVQGIAATGSINVNVSGAVVVTDGATAAKQDVGNASLASIDSKTPALGQALAAGSQPVVLTAAQLTTLTPPAAITGYSTSANQTNGLQLTQIVDAGGDAVTVTGGKLDVNATLSGSGGGTSAIDDAPFTVGTDTGTPTMSLFDDVAPDSVNEGDVGVTRMSANRNAYTTIRDAAGNERGVNVSAGNALLTDSSATTQPIGGNVAHDAVDSGNPVKIGGKVSTTVPTPVANADRTDAWYDEYGRLTISDKDIELGLTIGTTGLRDRLFAQRTTFLSDSLADGIAGFWTQTVANGGTIASTVGEGQLKTSTATNGSAQIVSTTVPYYPGQVAWLNSAIRFGDTGVVGNIRRLGMYTVSGTTPQEGFYYELNDTTLNAVTVKAGSATAVAQSSWTRNTVAPFTLDANYHSLEIRYTANTVWFYIDNVLRHQVSGTTTALTTSLTLPIAVTNVKTSGATDITFAVRNIGNGRFGEPGGTVNETGLSAVEARAVGGGTPHDSVDSGNPLKVGGRAQATAPTSVADGDRVNGWFTQSGALNIGANGTNVATGSGTSTGAMRVELPTNGTGVVGLNTGANVIGALTANQSVNAAQLGGTNTATNSGNSSAGTLRVVPANDSPGLLVDNAAFTDGTTRTVMQGYIFDEVAGTALTENDAAAARIDSKRAQVYVMEDAATRGQRAGVTTRGSSLNEGPTAADAAIAASPLTTGGRASAAAPTSMSADGDVVNTWMDLKGRQIVAFQSTTGTTTAVADAATSATILAANTSRKGAVIVNDSTEILYAKFGATATTTDYTYKMAPQSTLEIPFGYTGIIDGIWAANASGSARITELT